MVNAAASDHNVTIAVHVDAQGLDLRRPADAQTFYRRLKNAAQVVCTHGNRVGLEPADNPKGCYESSLGNAIRSVSAPLLTQIYFETHTLREGEAFGIHPSLQVAAK
jgi:UrcA family protein